MIHKLKRYEDQTLDRQIEEIASELNAVLVPVGGVCASATATKPTQGTWLGIGTQTIGTTTVTYYKRTA